MLQTQVDIKKKRKNAFMSLSSVLQSCLLLPWLVVSMVELLTIAVPATIFFSLLGVYLYFKVNRS